MPDIEENPAGQTNREEWGGAVMFVPFTNVKGASAKGGSTGLRGRDTIITFFGLVSRPPALRGGRLWVSVP